MNLLEDAIEARQKYIKDMEQENKEREIAKNKQMMQHLQSLCVKIFPSYQDEFEYFEKEPDLGKPYAQIADIKFLVSDTHGWLAVFLPCDTCDDHWTYMDYCYDLESFGRILEMPMITCGWCKEKKEKEQEKPDTMVLPESRKDRVFQKLLEIAKDLQTEIEMGNG